MKKCKYLKTEVQFSQGVSCYVSPIWELKAVISGHIHTPLAHPDPLAFPGKGSSEGSLWAWQPSPRVLDSCALTPSVFPHDLGWAWLLCHSCPRPRQPRALPPVCSPKPWPLALPANPSKTQASPPAPVQCLSLRASTKKPASRGFPQILNLHGCFFSVAAPWRGHPRAASPESTSSVCRGYSHLHSQGNRTHQGITGGWFEREAGGEHSPCSLGWTLCLFSSWPNLSMPRRPCLGPMHHFPRFGHRLSKKQSPPPGCCGSWTTQVVPDSLTKESAVLGAPREADYSLIYLEKCKVGLQLGRHGCCLLHRHCLLPLI